MYNIITIGTFEQVYSADLKQLYVIKLEEVRKRVSYFKSIEMGATVVFEGKERLGMLVTHIEIDCAEDKLKGIIMSVLKQFVGSFVPTGVL